MSNATESLSYMSRDYPIDYDRADRLFATDVANGYKPALMLAWRKNLNTTDKSLTEIMDEIVSKTRRSKAIFQFLNNQRFLSRA